MFAKNAWYVAAWSEDVTSIPLGRRICGESAVIYRDAEGTASILRDACCHRSAPLSLGRVTDAGLQCGYHGLVFDRTGVCVHIPGQDQIPSTARVPSYRVFEKNKIVWVWIGDPDLADESLVVDYPFRDEPSKWPYRQDTYRAKANHMLFIDNLMDLTHLAYVHRSTIGGRSATAHVEAEMITKKTARGVTMQRWLLKSEPPPTYKRAVPELPNTVDRWQEFEYLAPAVVTQWSGAVGIAADARHGGSREGGFSLRVFHGITPETETSCHYFWSVSNGYRQDDPTATDQLFSEVTEAFTEDKIILEAQQERLKEFGEVGQIAIRSDRARLLVHRGLRASA